MDAATRKQAESRLKLVAGQIAGIQRMIASQRYCVDVLLQLAAAQAAIAEVGRIILTNHVQTCVADAFATSSVRERRRKMDELLLVLGRFCVPISGKVKSRISSRRAAP